MNLSSYLEQHKSIREDILFIKNNASDVKTEKNVEELALHINQLAGKLKVHLLNEDKFLYPTLLNSKEDNIKRLAIQFQTEMGGLQERFIIFKEQYNTKSKILERSDSFLKDAKEIIKAIEERILREERGIYQYIS